MKPRNELIGYTLDFVSYLVSSMEGIDRVILFGSIARGDFDTESDIDLFIDTKIKKLEVRVSKLVESYYTTSRAKTWKLKGIERDFSCIVGELENQEWKDLKRAMMNNGIILYGKYSAAAEKVHHYTILSYGSIPTESKRVSVHRFLYGFTAGKTKYLGLTDKYHLIKLGTGCLLVPIEYILKIKKFFQEKKIPIKLYDMWSDGKIN